MGFRSNREIEGTAVGSKVQLTAPVRVLKGEFTEGSILEVIGEPDGRGEFLCRDLKSGEEVLLHPMFRNYRKYTD